MMDVSPQRICDFVCNIFTALKQTFCHLAFCGIQEEFEDCNAVLAKSQQQIFFQLTVHIFIVMSQHLFLLIRKEGSSIYLLIFHNDCLN